MSELQDFIQRNGRLPTVELIITPLDKNREQIVLNQFLSYSFSSSILIPVDAFSFTFAMPPVDGSISEFIQEGDIVELNSQNSVIATGIIDVVDVETTAEGGEVISIMGRNLLGQLEDQSAVNLQDKPMYVKNCSLSQAAGSVIQNTRIRGLVKQQPIDGTFLFATEPGESKISALQRFVEPLNCLVWGNPGGFMVIGRPNMGQDPIGDIVCDRGERFSNVLSIKAIRSSTQIPNIVIPIWSGQESVIGRVTPEQRINNPHEGPTRLRLAEHFVQKAIVVSTPSGSDPQSISDVNAIKVAGANLLQAYALREIARSSVHELTVQCNVKGHFNDNLLPFLIDQVYNVNYPRAGVQEKMYLYQVEYSLDAETGARTSLYFCKLGRIVAASSIAAAVKKVENSSNLPRA